MIIAIDGPAASGKGTIARRLAAHFGLPISTPACSTARSALRVLEAGGDPADAAAGGPCGAGGLEPGDLRPRRPARRRRGAAPRDGRRPSRRCAQALLEFQRDFARAAARRRRGGARRPRHRHGHLPGAEVKSSTSPPRPRCAPSGGSRSCRQRGDPAIYGRAAGHEGRDARDAARHRGLAAAADALDLDTSSLDADQVFAAALALHRAGRTAPKSCAAAAHRFAAGHRWSGHEAPASAAPHRRGADDRIRRKALPTEWHPRSSRNPAAKKFRRPARRIAERSTGFEGPWSRAASSRSRRTSPSSTSA